MLIKLKIINVYRAVAKSFILYFTALFLIIRVNVSRTKYMFVNEFQSMVRCNGVRQELNFQIAL